MATTLTLQTPRDYLLHRDVCSYGYFLLSPNHWEPSDLSFRTTLDLRADAGAVTVIVRQVGARGRSAAPDLTRVKPGSPLAAETDRALTASERARVEAMLTRMLRLDESHKDITAFHALDPRWSAAKRARGSAGSGAGRGRLMRSPTFFEDVIKTVTSCNVTWPSTIIMNEKLCRFFGARSASGHYAFPAAEQLAAARAASLRARCSVGYRDQRIVELARLFAQEAVAPLPAPSGDCPVERRLGAMADDELFDALQEWPGIGPYAAANIMQLMGRYSRLPLDTESVRHGRTVLGMKGTSASIMKRLHRHFAPFEGHMFRAYWFELWDFYERKRGPAWTWERETTGKSFTAAHFERDAAVELRASRSQTPARTRTGRGATRSPTMTAKNAVIVGVKSASQSSSRQRASTRKRARRA